MKSEISPSSCRSSTTQSRDREDRTLLKPLRRPDSMMTCITPPIYNRVSFQRDSQRATGQKEYLNSDHPNSDISGILECDVSVVRIINMSEWNKGMRNSSSVCLLIINTLLTAEEKRVVIYREVFLSPVWQWPCTTAVGHVLLNVSSGCSHPCLPTNVVPSHWPNYFSALDGHAHVLQWTDSWYDPSLLGRKSLFCRLAFSKGYRRYHGKYSILFYSTLTAL